MFQTKFPSLYTPDFIYHCKVNIHSIIDFFYNEGESLREWNEETWEMIYEYYMQMILCYLELPEDCLDEEGLNLPEAEDEAERIMFRYLPEVAKDDCLRTAHSNILRKFRKKMESWTYKTEEERKDWYNFFRKMLKKAWRGEWRVISCPCEIPV